MPVRILYVIGTLDVGGAETQLVEMVRRLGPDFAPSVCCLGSEGPLAAELRQANVPVFVAGLRGVWQQRGLQFFGALIRLPRDLVRFARHVRACHPAILHGVLFHAYVLGAFAGVLARVPVIVASRRSLALFKERRPHYRLAERLANRWTDLVIANSEAVRADAIRSESLREARVVVIYNGLDPDRYRQVADAELRRALGLGVRPVAIVVANFIHYKGHSDFLKAWAEVCRTRVDAVALLAGDGPMRPSCEAEARALGIEGRVRFLGTRRDIPALLAIADLLVHPSHQEGFCNALLEAMAAARPVVATDVGGNAEAVCHGETGLLVPARSPGAMAAAILTVLGRPDRGRAMGEAGRQRVLAEFERSTMVRRYEAVYHRLLAARQLNPSHVRDRRSA